MTSPLPGCYSWRQKYWFVMTSGLIQHESPLSDYLFLFTLPIWGTDLHCDSRLFPFPLPQGLGYEVRFELTEKPEPKATGTKFLEGKRRELWYESETKMRPSPWENTLGLSSLCWRIPFLCNMALSIQEHISSRLLACQSQVGWVLLSGKSLPLNWLR